MKRALLLSTFLALLLAALPPLLAAAGYVIYLKDGNRINCKDKPVVEGDRVVFLTPIGITQSIYLKDVDFQKTEEMNKLGTGDSYILQSEPASGLNPGAKKTSLSEFIRSHRTTKVNFGGTEPQAANPAAAAPEAAAKKEPEPSGPPADPMVSDTFLRALESSGIRGPQLSSIQRGVKIQAKTDSEQQVFAALGAVARGLKEARATGRPIERAELVLSTTSGEPAGRFEISPDDAESLLTGKIGAPQFFIQNVIF